MLSTSISRRQADIVCAFAILLITKTFTLIFNFLVLSFKCITTVLLSFQLISL
jgi:hypothetical protein